MTQERRVTFSAFGDSRTGNRGAVSMLESAIDHLTSCERPGTVNVFTVYPKADRKLPTGPHVRLFSGSPASLAFKLVPLCVAHRLLQRVGVRLPPRWWGRSMQALLSTDVCLLIGGTTFNDAQTLKILYNVACLLPAILLDIRAMMYSQTLGPFRRALNCLTARWTLSRIDAIVARGPGSLENVRSLGLPTPVAYYTDAAFSLLVPEEVEKRIRAEYAWLRSGLPVVGISVNSIVERKCRARGIDHHSAWVAFIDYLVEKGYRVLLIPHSLRKRSVTRHNNDLPSTRAIAARLAWQQGVYVVDAPYDCRELRAVVGLADYYVASRFHAMISALCCRVPVLVFGWGFHKYREVLEEFELEAFCHDAAELSAAALTEGFEQLVRRRDEVKAKISKHLARVQRSSAKNHEVAWKLARGAGMED